MIAPPAVAANHAPLDAVDRAEYGVDGGGAVVLFTAEQAAAMLQVRSSWLRRKAAARAIPCRYLGKHLRFTREDITAITDQYAATTTDTRVPGRNPTR